MNAARRAWRWYSGITDPDLEPGERIRRKLDAAAADGHWWSNRAGRLVLTDHHLIFSPYRPVVLPKFMAARPMMSRLDEIRDASVHKSIQGFLFAEGPELVVAFRDGTQRRFKCFDAHGFAQELSPASRTERHK